MTRRRGGTQVRSVDIALGREHIPHVTVRDRLAIAIVALAATAAGCARAPVADRPETRPLEPVCNECFWSHQPEGFREELIEVYRDRTYPDPLVDAQRRLIVARVSNDRDAVCEARSTFALARETDPGRGLIAAETAAFLARTCGVDVATAFEVAADAAAAAGDRIKAKAYRAIARGRFRPRFASQEIGRSLDVPSGVTAFVLGESAIRVADGAEVVVQAERTVRDWISYQIDDAFGAAPPERDRIITWHEGARLRDLMAAADVRPIPVRGVLVARRDGRWMAGDERGIFRFEVLEDKIQYPTTLVDGEVGLFLDSHGVSSIQGTASRRHAPLAIACGDHPAKMQAAFRIAERGGSVWFPCDRFVGEVLGYRARGVLLGSAPVRSDPAGGAIIGDRPVRFRIDETLVVEDADVRGAFQYYDAAARYFRALARSAPLRLEIVEVDGPDQSSRVVDRAREIGATAIALLVMTEDDAAPVRAWLAESREHRAVLFHTAPYPAGYALFGDFPEQTTFGDPRPRFLTATSETPADSGS